MKTRRIENNLSSFVKDLNLHIKTNSFIILYVHYTINLFFLKAVLMKGFRKLFTNDKKYYRKNFVLGMRFAMRSCWCPLQATKFCSLIFCFLRKHEIILLSHCRRMRICYNFPKRVDKGEVL